MFVSFERRENGEGYPCKNTAKTRPNMREDVKKKILNTQGEKRPQITCSGGGEGEGEGREAARARSDGW